MEKRKILTSHGALAALASERIIVGRFMILADALRDHEGPPGDAGLREDKQRRDSNGSA